MSYVKSMIEIKYLRLVQAVAEHGSLSAVAQALGYSQPAISQQIQMLERLIGGTAFIRARKGTMLNEIGRTLLDCANQVIPMVEKTQSDIDSILGLRSGVIRFAAFPSAAATLIPKAFAGLNRKIPKVRLQLAEATPEQSLDLIRSGQVDIALVFAYGRAGSSDPFQDLLLAEEVSVPLLEEDIFVALPEGWSQGESEWIDLTALRDSRWIAGCESCRGHMTQVCHENGFEPDVNFETDDYIALQSLVSAGLGVALIPDLMLAATNVTSPINLRRINPAPVRFVSAIFSASSARMPGMREAIHSLQSAVKELPLQRPTATVVK